MLPSKEQDLFLRLVGFRSEDKIGNGIVGYRVAQSLLLDGTMLESFLQVLGAKGLKLFQEINHLGVCVRQVQGEVYLPFRLGFVFEAESVVRLPILSVDSILEVFY